MTVDEGSSVRYRSRRRSGRPVGHDIAVRPGSSLDDVDELDHWLTGRWRAYTRTGDRIGVVPVQHSPWRLRDAAVVELEETLLVPPPCRIRAKHPVSSTPMGSTTCASDRRRPSERISRVAPFCTVSTG